MNHESLAVIIVAAGRGARAGGPMPKQFLPLCGRSVLTRTVEAFRAAAPSAPVVVVIHPDDETLARRALASVREIRFVSGGSTRQASVRAGLEALRSQNPNRVLIHDAARPLVSRETIGAVVAALENADGAIAAAPLSDTLKSANDGRVTGTIPRDGLWRAQTPQGFHYAAIVQAHQTFADLDLTDDAALAERAGLNVAIVPAPSTNMKLTVPEDFGVAEALLLARTGDVRTGSGFDVHKFGPGDHLWLCGVRIPHAMGLIGHSDADVGLHALTDAILGTLSEGDIGVHFPPSDPQWRGAPSERFLAHAAALVKERGGFVAHVDVTLICESPKVGPHRDAMRNRIAQILDLEVERVSVKATTTERLGFTGRGEGIAAQAIATVRLPG